MHCKICQSNHAAFYQQFSASSWSGYLRGTPQRGLLPSPFTDHLKRCRGIAPRTGERPWKGVGRPAWCLAGPAALIWRMLTFMGMISRRAGCWGTVSLGVGHGEEDEPFYMAASGFSCLRGWVSDLWQLFRGMLPAEAVACTWIQLECTETRRLCHLVRPGPTWRRWLSPSSSCGRTRMYRYQSTISTRDRGTSHLRAPSQKTGISCTCQHCHKARGVSPSRSGHVPGDVAHLFGKSCLSQPPCSAVHGKRGLPWGRAGATS